MTDVQTTKTCPYCAEEIQAEAILCRYCRRPLDGPIPGPVMLPGPAGTGPAGTGQSALPVVALVLTVIAYLASSLILSRIYVGLFIEVALFLVTTTLSLVAWLSSRKQGSGSAMALAALVVSGAMLLIAAFDMLRFGF